jgi:hypothetical protein
VVINSGFRGGWSIDDVYCALLLVRRSNTRIYSEIETRRRIIIYYSFKIYVCHGHGYIYI